MNSPKYDLVQATFSKMTYFHWFISYWSIHNLTNLFPPVTCGVRHFPDTTGSVKVSRAQKDDVASLRTALLWLKETIVFVKTHRL